MTHALIIGAGIGGLTAAIALAQNGASVDIFEQANELTEVGAGLQQSPNAMAVHAAIGTSAAVKAAAFEPEAGSFRDYQSGASIIHTQMAEIYEARYGHKYLHIHRADLQNILIGAARKAGVKIHLGCRVEGYDQDETSVTINTSGAPIRGDILIGADGIQSEIRASILGETKARFTGQVAWRGLVKAGRLPAGTIASTANCWMGPGRHFVAYYLRGGSLINFVAVEERTNWATEDWQQRGDMDELRAAFADWDAPVTALLDACEECHLWGLFDHAPLAKWSHGRASLLGDAAHPMLPFMAQGAAMAIEDGWVIAHNILTKNNIPAALKSYEAARKPRTIMLQKMSRQNGELFHTRTGLGKSLRAIKFGIGKAVPAAMFAKLDKVYGHDVTTLYPITR